MSFYSIWNMQYNLIAEKFVHSCIWRNLFDLPRLRDQRNEGLYVTTLNYVRSAAKLTRRHTSLHICLQRFPRFVKFMNNANNNRLQTDLIALPGQGGDFLPIDLHPYHLPSSGIVCDAH